jgi:hypothetical protein
MKTKSEFGKGFFYCLSLYGQHAMELRHFQEDFAQKEKEIGTPFKTDLAITIWASGAQDHLHELEIPEKYKGTKIGRLAEQIKKIMHQLRYYGWSSPINQVENKKPAEELVTKVIKNLDKIFFLLDEEIGANPVKATWK